MVSDLFEKLCLWFDWRLRIELADVSALSEWISVTTDKEPAGVLHLNKAIKRDDAVKVRTMLMTEKVTSPQIF